MVYLLYGDEDYFINREIENIIKKNNIDEFDISKYEYDNSIIKDIVEDAMTVSLFSSPKLILVNHANFVTNQKNKDENIDITPIEECIQHLSSDTHLVFINDKVNSNKKIVKLLKKVGTVKECGSNTNLNNLAKELLDGYKIDYNVINLLVDRINGQVPLLKQECEKLRMYKLDEKEITKEDVINLVPKTIDLDIFHLLDNIINKNKDKAMEVYSEMLKYNEEPIKIIIMLANQFRLMYQAKELIKKGYTEQDIAKKLEVHPYPVKLALQKSRGYDSHYLLSLLSQLADIDLDIKSGKIKKELALDLFILNL